MAIIHKRRLIMDKSRRRLIKSAAGLVTTLAAHSLGASTLLTPRQTAGPFYPAKLPLDDDNDLTRVRGQEQSARGEISDLHGRLLDRNGHPLAGVRIEIWQCDANGRYRHPRDPGRQPIDPGFQGFGHTLSDAEGNYRFRTIRPVAYPGRTPHIHVAVRPPGEEPFVTQFYIAGEERNAGDFLFQRIPAEQRPLVLMDFMPGTEAGSPLQAKRDLILGIS
jgi:protocatechuate 3,4-dioxygenase beta subunit